MNEVRVGGPGWVVIAKQYDKDGNLTGWTEVPEGTSISKGMQVVDEPGQDWQMLGYTSLEELYPYEGITIPWDGAKVNTTRSTTVSFDLVDGNFEEIWKLLTLPDPEPWQERLLREELRLSAELGCLPHHPRIERA